MEEDEGQRTGRQHQGEVRSHPVSEASAVRVSAHLHSPTGTLYALCSYAILLAQVAKNALKP